MNFAISTFERTRTQVGDTLQIREHIRQPTAPADAAFIMAMVETVAPSSLEAVEAYLAKPDLEWRTFQVEDAAEDTDEALWLRIHKWEE